MKLNIIATNVMEKLLNENYNVEILEMEYKNTSTLKDLRDIIKAPMSGITFDKYYSSGEFRFYNNSLPYIIKQDGKIEFAPSIDDILINEFLGTHNINNETIEVEYGFPQAGGPDLIEWNQIWNIVWNSIQIFSTVGGAVAFIDFIKTKFSNKKTIPHEIMECLYKRDCWNYHELAERLNIDIEESKELLRFFGYSWDNSKKMYIINKDKQEKIEKIIQNIKYLEE